MKIAIKFKDNDFYNTFYGVLNTLKEAKYWTGGVVTDKEKLCEIINEISYGCYLTFQVGAKREPNYYIKDYLKISPEDILLDDEVDDYFEKLPFNNGDTYFMDLDDVNKKY